MDCVEATSLILLDLSAAFDAVDHSILLTRLQNWFGLDGLSLDWFSSYLSLCSQAVSINDSISAFSTLSCGVPQGSLLGPLFSTHYTTPLGLVISKNSLKYHLYADDTQLYISFTPTNSALSLETLTTTFNVILSWMNLNKLLLNPSKTEFLLIGTKQQYRPEIWRQDRPSSIIFNHGPLKTISNWTVKNRKKWSSHDQGPDKSRIFRSFLTSDGWWVWNCWASHWLDSFPWSCTSRRWFRHLPVLYMHSAFFGPMEWGMQTYRQCSEQRRYPNSCMHPPPGGDSPMLIKGTALKVSFGKLPGHDSTLRDLPLSRICVRQLMWRCSTAL